MRGVEMMKTIEDDEACTVNAVLSTCVRLQLLSEQAGLFGLVSKAVGRGDDHVVRRLAPPPVPVQSLRLGVTMKVQLAC